MMTLETVKTDTGILVEARFISSRPDMFIVGIGLNVNGHPEDMNATSLGLRATDAMPMDPSKLPGNCAVFDIIAGRETEFMTACAARGLKVVDGKAMIRHQLPLQTAFWRGEA